MDLNVNEPLTIERLPILNHIFQGPKVSKRGDHRLTEKKLQSIIYHINVYGKASLELIVNFASENIILKSIYLMEQDIFFTIEGTTEKALKF